MISFLKGNDDVAETALKTAFRSLFDYLITALKNEQTQFLRLLILDTLALNYRPDDLLLLDIINFFRLLIDIQSEKPSLHFDQELTSSYAFARMWN